MLGRHINHCEDSLTACVFTLLLHLPSEVFWQILRNACCTDSLPKSAGEPLQIDPWPRWNPAGTTNTDCVVPDLFMRFSEFDLIIEAKRWDNNMQDPAQWKNEVIAYSNGYENHKPLKMIALGGIWQNQDEEVEAGGIRCLVHMCRWSRLLDECKRMNKELQRLKYSSSHIRASARTLEHLIDLFAWHGFSTGQWFSDFDFARYRLSSPTISCLDVFPKCN